MTALHPNTAWQGVLTPRQAEVLEALAEGLSNGAIGRRLFVTEQTVKHHLGVIYLTLGLSHPGAGRGEKAGQRVRAARWWIEHVERP